MEDSKESRIKQEAKVSISTPKFRAFPVRSKAESVLSTVSTARKSIVKARNTCPSCGVKVNRSEMVTCDNCGTEVCNKCRKQSNEDVYDKQSSKHG